MVDKKQKQRVYNNQDISGIIFLGCIIVGVAIGTFFGNIWEGAITGFVVGLASKMGLDARRRNSK